LILFSVGLFFFLPLNGDFNCRDGEKKRDSTLKENITLSLSLCVGAAVESRAKREKKKKKMS
jgi:hypothetical protein